MFHSRFPAGVMLLVTCAVTPSIAGAQEPGPESHIERPYLFGSFVRVSGGMVAPLFSSGSMSDWSRGRTLGLAWESTGPERDRSRVALGFAGDIGRFPLDEARFIANYPTDSTGGRPTSASAPNATLLDLQASIRINIPAPVVTPSVIFALGYYRFRPSAVTFQTPDSVGTAHFRTRSGASFSLGAGVDRQLVGPAGIFVEALYMLGATPFGFIAASSRCPYGTCDIYRNTYIGTVRGGLRFRIGS